MTSRETTSREMTSAELTCRLSHGHHLTRERSPKTLHGLRRAVTSFQSRPRLRFGEQLAELGEQRGRGRAGGVELFDARKPVEHGGRFVHGPTLAPRRTHVCAGFVPKQNRENCLEDRLEPVPYTVVMRRGAACRRRRSRAVHGRARARAR